MGFDELKKTVLDRANSEADKIIAEAQAQASERKKKVEEEARKYEKKAELDVKRTIELIEKRKISSCSLETKKQNLLTKKNLIEKVFEKVKKDIKKKVTAKDRKAIVAKLLKDTESQIEVSKVFCNKDDMKNVDGSEEADILGGIIVENKEGTVSIDCSFDAMIDNIKDRHISELTNILFD